jgi:hypothetical protein
MKQFQAERVQRQVAPYVFKDAENRWFATVSPPQDYTEAHRAIQSALSARDLIPLGQTADVRHWSDVDGYKTFSTTRTYPPKTIRTGRSDRLNVGDHARVLQTGVNGIRGSVVQVVAVMGLDYRVEGMSRQGMWRTWLIGHRRVEYTDEPVTRTDSF